MPHKLTPTAVANLIQPPDGTPSPVSVEILEALVSILNPREQDEVLRHLGRDHVHRHFPTLLASFTDDLADAAPQTADDTDSEEDREEDLHGSSVFHVSDLEDNDADHDGSSLCPLSDFETPPDSPVLSSTPISTQSAIHVSAAASKGKAREAPVASASRAATADRQLPSTSATTRKYHFSNATESGETDSWFVAAAGGSSVPGGQVGYPSAETAEAAIKHARSKGWTSDTTKGALAAPQPSTDDNPLSAAGPDLCTPLLGLARRPSESFSLLWTPGSSRLSSALAPSLRTPPTTPTTATWFSGMYDLKYPYRTTSLHVLMRDIGLDSDTQPDTSELPSHEASATPTPNCRNFDELPFTLAAPPPLVSPSLSMPPKSSTPSPDPPEARSRGADSAWRYRQRYKETVNERARVRMQAKRAALRQAPPEVQHQQAVKARQYRQAYRRWVFHCRRPDAISSQRRRRANVKAVAASGKKRIDARLRTYCDSAPSTTARSPSPGVVATPAHSCSSSPVTASPCSPPSTPTPPPTEETYYGEDEDAPSDDAGSDDDSDFFCRFSRLSAVRGTL
ncbi:hypothetical protein R3P38DRAFT_2802170 [Favolaschia claudopus]|uniref:Uncharacterized protein n=1 Tax=Favolaschia claudopus TaxID=2862362 RepID=A0AAV9ZUT6_9AGAR